MNRDDEMVRHEFAPGEEPTVYTTDICAVVGHEHCTWIDRTIEGYEGEAVFCICSCHRFVALEPNKLSRSAADDITS
jgi:hypothetical protein